MEIAKRIEDIYKCTECDYSTAEIPKQKTCPFCGSLNSLERISS